MAILKTCDHWDIWSEWWEDTIWQKRQRQRQRQRHFENTFKGRSLRLVTFEILDQSDEETWHDQQRQRHSENTTTNTYEIEVWNCCHFRQLRTWVHDNHCYLGIKSDTGQHSQFLRCLCKIHRQTFDEHKKSVTIWDAFQNSWLVCSQHQGRLCHPS